MYGLSLSPFLSHFPSLPYAFGQVPAVDIVQRIGDLITIIVPPALPACMTIGISFALSCVIGKKKIRERRQSEEGGKARRSEGCMGAVSELV
jgi:hypothetical protein